MTWADTLEQAAKSAIGWVVPAGFGVFGILFNRLSSKVKAGKDADRADREKTQALLSLMGAAQLALIQDRVSQAHDFYVGEMGYFPLHKRRDLGDMIKAAQALGADGTLDDLYGRMCELPLISPKDKEKE